MKKLTLDYEIILVEDGSSDQSWAVIEKICENDKKVIGLKLSRNFGQHNAITAGLENVRGDWVVVMDCDLQDKPEEIENLYKKAMEGYDMVFAVRTNRKDNFFKKLSSRIFYMIFSFLTDTEQNSSIANFGIYHRKVILALLSMKDHIRFFPTMVRWTGFLKTKIHVQHSSRFEGKTSYTFSKITKLAFDNMIAFSDKPLWIMLKLGAIIAFCSFGIGIHYIIQYYRGLISEPGFTSLIVSIWFLSGIILFMLGIVGIYVGKTFESSKERPLYLIDKKINR